MFEIKKKEDLKKAIGLYMIIDDGLQADVCKILDIDFENDEMICNKITDIGKEDVQWSSKFDPNFITIEVFEEDEIALAMIQL